MNDMEVIMENVLNKALGEGAIESVDKATKALLTHNSRVRNYGIAGALGGTIVGGGIGTYLARKNIAALKQKIKDENNAKKKDQLRNQLRLLYASIAGDGVIGGASGMIAGRRGAGAYTKYAVNKAGKDVAKEASEAKDAAAEVINKGVADAKNAMGNLFKKK